MVYWHILLLLSLSFLMHYSIAFSLVEQQTSNSIIIQLSPTSRTLQSIDEAEQSLLRWYDNLVSKVYTHQTIHKLYIRGRSIVLLFLIRVVCDHHVFYCFERLKRRLTLIDLQRISYNLQLQALVMPK